MPRNPHNYNLGVSDDAFSRLQEAHLGVNERNPQDYENMSAPQTAARQRQAAAGPTQFQGQPMHTEEGDDREGSATDSATPLPGGGEGDGEQPGLQRPETGDDDPGADTDGESAPLSDPDGLATAGTADTGVSGWDDARDNRGGADTGAHNRPGVSGKHPAVPLGAQQTVAAAMAAGYSQGAKAVIDHLKRVMVEAMLSDDKHIEDFAEDLGPIIKALKAKFK